MIMTKKTASSVHCPDARIVDSVDNAGGVASTNRPDSQSTACKGEICRSWSYIDPERFDVIMPCALEVADQIIAQIEAHPEHVPHHLQKVNLPDITGLRIVADNPVRRAVCRAAPADEREIAASTGPGIAL